jgi:outer membrane protein TolC
MVWSHQGKMAALIVVLCCCFTPLTSCRSILVNPFASVNHVEFVNSKSAMTLINRRVKPATAVAGKRFLSLDECRSLALANNLELQATRLEELTQSAIRYSNQTRLLPHFLYSGDLSDRSALRYSYSDVLGQEGTPPRTSPGSTGVTSFSTGHERSTWYQVLETRWSPTDAALAYYVTKSASNDRIKAHYRTVRTAQKLVEMVDTAYFRLLGQQECLPMVQRLVSLRRGVRDKIERLFESRLSRIEDYHRVEQKFIRSERFLTRLRSEIETQRDVLASAMGLSPDYSVDGGFFLVGNLTAPQYSSEIPEMEMVAVQRRPEAFEAGLSHLNSVNDLKRTIMKYFPKVTGFWRYARDKDKYLYDKDWKEVGVSIYFDFIEWFATAEESKAAQIRTEKTEREMGAVALGITSQVRVGALKYFDALDEFRSSRNSLASSRRLLAAIEARHELRDVERLAVEEAQGDFLEAKIDQMRTLGEANAALAALQSAMGTNYTEMMSKE